MKELIILLKDIIYRTAGLLVFIPVFLLSPFKLMRFKPEEVKEILVFSWGGLGNFIMLLPFLKALKDGFGKSVIHIVTMNRAQYDFIKSLMPEINVIFMPQDEEHIISGIKFLKKAFKKRSIDLSFHPYLEHTGRSVWWSRSLGTRIIIGFASSIFGPWQTVRLKLNRDKSEGENYLDMLRSLNMAISLDGKLIDLNDEVKNSTRAFIYKNLDASEKIIGFHCGSSTNYKEKRWSADKFIALINMILSAFNDIGIIAFFGPDESDIHKKFSCAFSSNRRVYVMNGNDISMLCGCLERLSLFVTNDSGLMHLASAMGIPIISIWGPTDPVKNRPWGNNFDIIRLGLDCSPCYKIGHINTCIKRLCLENITAEMIFDVISKKL